MKYTRNASLPPPAQRVGRSNWLSTGRLALKCVSTGTVYNVLNSGDNIGPAQASLAQAGGGNSVN